MRVFERQELMGRRCAVSGKGILSGNNVSHANNKTRRRFVPNMQHKSFYSETLGRSFRMRLSTNGIRTVEHRGGFDAYLLSIPDPELDARLRRVKRLIEGARAAG